MPLWAGEAWLTASGHTKRDKVVCDGMRLLCNSDNVFIQAHLIPLDMCQWDNYVYIG